MCSSDLKIPGRTPAGTADLGDVGLDGDERSGPGRCPSGDLGQRDELLALQRLCLVRERVELRSGDRLVLYTDGITECANADGTELGEENLASVISENVQLPASELKDRVLDSVLGHCNGDLSDDATLIVVAVE